MKYVVGFFQLLMSVASLAATPIDGLYTSMFGGYVYIPGNISYNTGTGTLNSPSYQGGFDAGGSIGYKSNPMRYEGEVTYLKAEVNQFYLDDTLQTTPGGTNEAIFGMANIFYDIPNMNPLLQPYVGAGIGYGWVQARLSALGPSVTTSFSAQNSTFAYQAMAGVTFNFAENYAVSAGYRYLGTSNLSQFGEIFQVHMINAIATYRFDGNNYK
jgi:opacity protein-like surface antigen